MNRFEKWIEAKIDSHEDRVLDHFDQVTRFVIVLLCAACGALLAHVIAEYAGR